MATGEDGTAVEREVTAISTSHDEPRPAHQVVVHERDGLTIIDQRPHRCPVGVHLNFGWGLGLCRSGHYRRTARGEEQTVDPNSGFFRATDDEVEVAQLDHHRVEVTFLDVDPAVVPFITEVGKSSPQIPITPDLDLLHRRLLRAHRARAEALVIESIALSLVTKAVSRRNDAMSRFGRVRTAAAHRALVADACELMHVHDDLGLLALAKLVSASPFHLSRVFREVTGVTIPQYRKQLRVRSALARFDDESPGSLASIAAESGFADHSHMTRTFVEQFGHSPSAIRDLLREHYLEQLRWLQVGTGMPFR